ncbi:Uu.00g067290.m01.CDS01 [Anthostomella pinea]|uniref:Uu.00g067290.m01.CDS01 n=1 Tax=Anthostomella pinea TaxID=933095 RepID=A0AAI8YN89_9PEZI|nr:Uu.00g067290.m01.CDS01 [Anthostomella pinea]
MLITCSVADPMATVTESAPRSTPSKNPDGGMGARTVPIITTPTPTPTIKTSAPSPAGEPMDITTPTNSSAPQSVGKSSEGEGSDSNDRLNTAPTSDQHSASSSNSMPAPAAAAAAVHQPKIVQTAFIHKLYNMLEDPNIQHLISWSSSAESFVMSPSHDFSKVLAYVPEHVEEDSHGRGFRLMIASQYFKHTNISSFVRQLNMYGFHKVSDVFHTGSPETALWEFKHGNGNFKRGDLVGLREIKRRASRHALVHREYNNQKPTPSQPGTPAEPMPSVHDGLDPRHTNIEHSLYEATVRLQRSEHEAHYMQVKQQTMVETINRLLQFNHELSRTVLSLVPPDNPAHRDVMALQGEIQRQSEAFRMIDEPHEPPVSGSRQYFANLDNPPLSPRQLAQDDRNAIESINQLTPALWIDQWDHDPIFPFSSSIPTTATTTWSSPSANPPPPPPPPYLNSGPPSSHWPSSPSRMPVEDYRGREPPSHYSLSRPATPPAPPFSNGNIGNGLESLNNWSWNSAGRENRNLSIKDMSAPPTRRGSMAHILNPTDTVERDDEDDPRENDDRKRRRM